MDVFFDRLDMWLSSFISDGIRDTIMKSIRVSYICIVITLPVVVIIRILASFGFVDLITTAIEPIMGLLHLPGEAAIIWAVAITANLYAALIAFVALGADFTVLETTVIACLLLGTHSIFVEMIFVAKTGCKLILFSIARIVMSIISAYLVGAIMGFFDVGGETTTVLFVPTTSLDVTWSQWAYDTSLLIGSIPVIAFAMIAIIDILQYFKLTDIISKGLAFLLSPLQIKTNDACQLTLVGVLLGLGFGGALLVEEAKKGHIPNRDISIVMMFLCNVHAAIEDNILLTLLGAWLWGFVVIRTIIGYAMVVVFGLIVTKMRDEIFYKHIFNRPS